MKLAWIPKLWVAGSLLLAPCGCAGDDTSDDGSNDDGAPTTGGADDGVDDGGPTGTPGTGTGDPDPADTGTPGTETGDPDTGDTTAGDDGTTTDGGQTDTGGAGATVWDLEVAVNLGGEFDVTADTTITVTRGSFDADVVTVNIAGAPEEHMIPLAGTVDGETLTMTDSMFSIEVGGVPEDVSVSGTATITADNLTGSGDFTTAIDGGEPFPGTWAIVNATLVE